MTAKETGFLQLRRGLWDHVRDGRMYSTEAVAFIYICSQADTRTGIWIGSAGALAGELKMPRRTARYILEKLEQDRYIRRFPIPGRHCCYPILVHRLLLTNGQHVGKQLNAWESTSPTDLRYLDPPADCQHVVKQVATQKRSKKEEVILNTLGDAYADTQLSASEVAAREPLSAAPPKARAASERQRATRFPENFLLGENLRGYAVEHGMPAGEVESQFEHFENFHKAKGSRFMDWNRAWYTWVGNYKQFQRGARHGESATERRRREADEQTARVVAMLQAKRAH